MKTKIILTALLIITVALSIFRVNDLKNENSRLLGNQEVLLSQKEAIMAESQSYKVSDSLNAAKVSELRLTLAEYKKYRAQDLKMIENLKVKKSDLQKIVDSQTETINSLSTKLTDFIKTDSITNITDTLKCFEYKSKWTDVEGRIDLKKDSIDMRITNRESLKIVETVIYKRFLGFLWKTNKVKDRQVDVVSENPSTSIINLDYISIER